MFFISLPSISEYSEENKKTIEDGLQKIGGESFWEIDKDTGCAIATVDGADSGFHKIISCFDDVRVINAESLISNNATTMSLLIAEAKMSESDFLLKKIDKIGAVIVIVRRNKNDVKIHLWAKPDQISDIKRIPGIISLYGSMGEVTDPARILVATNNKNFFVDKSLGVLDFCVSKRNGNQQECVIPLANLPLLDKKCKKLLIAWHFIDN